jgi:7-cyano-7-deazaguanine synthase in queuosine biosynthesis
MSKYQNFIFKNYEFNHISKKLRLYYSYDGILNFCETYTFDFEFDQYEDQALDRAIFSLFIMSGISYFKSYLAPNIVIEKGQLTEFEYSFFKNTYQKGLGEFFYVNSLDPKTEINFPNKNFSNKSEINFQNKGILLGIGGGKDSLLSYEYIKDEHKDLVTWSLGHREQLEPLVKKMNSKHYFVERDWDRQILDINREDAYNGHVPISAIFGLVGVVLAVLLGIKDVVVSNEQSANEASLDYRGVSINHQFSKTTEFEKMLQTYIKNNFADSIQYYSFLRPLSEVYIAELFAKHYFDKYQTVFSSCNHAYTNQNHKIYWCGKCPKCAFIFLAFTPFIERNKLESLWSKNLILDPNLDQLYRQILGIYGDKPLECVGEIKESRAAMKLAQQIYPELSRYQFNIPSNYYYRDLSTRYDMPVQMYELLKKQIKI